MLRALIEAGMDVARIGLAHGTSADHLAKIRALREAASECGRTIGVIVDLPGPKVRCGEFPEGGVDIIAGTEVEIVPGSAASTGRRITVQYPHLAEDVEPGDHVVLGDGTVELCVEGPNDDGVAASVVHGGHLEGRPGAHLPAERIRLSTPTDEDARLLEAVRPAEPDVIAVSFVRDGDDVAKARELIGEGPLVLAKIETRSAVQHLDAVGRAG
jgi:pyruvate kinase